MTPTDWGILDFLADGSKPIAELLGRYPKATVYQRLRKLRDEGLVTKFAQGYALTATGERALAERDAQVFSEGLVTAYPPLREVPTPQYRALFELAFAASALRRHTDQDERHAGFLIVGPTLTGKTSAAEFLALALGVDPTTHIADLQTERGQSLWIRRGATGEVVTQRGLLEAPIAAFDEYQAADRAVRRAVAPFLTGRRRLPIENDIVTVSPVPIVIMNPAAGTTLAARTGLSEAQLRRLIPLDVSGLSMPDLAASGRRPLDAARRAGPFTIPPPRTASEGLRQPLVEMLRRVLTSEGLKLLDVEVLLGLGRGMTAWFSPIVALRHATYCALLVVESVGWSKPGWVDAVRAFPHGHPGRSSSIARQESVPVPTGAPGHLTIPLFPEQHDSALEDPSMATSDSMMPDFTLSNESKAEVVWLSRELGLPLDAAVAFLVDHYRFMGGQSGGAFADLKAIVRLRKACAEARVTVADLRQCVELKVGLREHDLAIDDVQEAIEVAQALDGAGLTLEEARGVAELTEALDKAGVDATVPDQLRTALARYQALGYDPERITAMAGAWSRLEALSIGIDDLRGHLDHLERLDALGLDQPTAAVLARTLDAAGIAQGDRGVVLQHVVDAGCTAADCARLEEERERLAREIAAHESTLATRHDALAEIDGQVDAAQSEHDRLQHDGATLLEQCRVLRDAMGSATALERFLLQHTTIDDPMWTKLELLLKLKRNAPALVSTVQDWITPDVRQRVRNFLDQIAGGEARPGTSAAR